MTHHFVPAAAYPLLLFPRRLLRNLERVQAAQIVPHTPNPWQITLGVARMWHRLIFRPDTVGTSPDGRVRDTWRARLLHLRPLRFPFLIAEHAIAPWDMSGLVSSTERITRHLLGAYHDYEEFTYDLEILQCYPGALEQLQARAHAVVHEDTRRSRWLRDLVVFEGYHERLLARVNAALDHGIEVTPKMETNPDHSLRGYLRWCAAQPETPRDTVREWRSGGFRVATGRRAAQAEGQP